MSDLLKQIRASNPVDEELVQTLEIVHPGLPDGVVRFARSYVDIVADTASDSGVTFLKSAIHIDYPERGVTGNQDLLVSISNVNKQAWGYAKTILVANRIRRAPAFIHAHMYALSDLTAPLESYRMEAKNIATKGDTISIVAGYKELFNRAAFARRYNATDHPGLKYP